LSWRAVRLIPLEELSQDDTLGNFDGSVELAVRQKQRDEVVARRVCEPAAFEKFKVLLDAMLLPLGFLLALGFEGSLVFLSVITEDNPIPTLLQFEGCHVVALSMPFCPDFVPTPQGMEAAHGR